jgi:hypothetical protein
MIALIRKARVPGQIFLAWRHDSWRMVEFIYYVLYNKQLQVSSARSCAAPVRATGKGRPYGPSIPYKITPAGSLISSQPGGTPFRAITLAFGLFFCDCRWTGAFSVDHAHKNSHPTLKMGRKIRHIMRISSVLFGHTVVNNSLTKIVADDF